jgi:magnesium transporter
LQALIREWQTVGLIAVTSGVIVGVVSLFWGDGIFPGLTIGFGIMVSVIISASIGSIVPLVLHARKWDPRVAAGPVVLMFADVLTTLIYLSLGTWWLL